MCACGRRQKTSVRREGRGEKRKRKDERRYANGTKERIPGEPWWLGEISLFSDITPVIVMPSNWIRFVHLVEWVEYLGLFPLLPTLSLSLFLSSIFFRFFCVNVGMKLILLRTSSSCSNNIFYMYILFDLAKQNRTIHFFVCFKLFVCARFSVDYCDRTFL